MRVRTERWRTTVFQNCCIHGCRRTTGSVVEVRLPLDGVNSCSGWESVAGSECVAVPWHVSHLCVILVGITGCTGVTVAVVTVAVSTGIAVDLDGRVDRKREHTVFRHQPVCFHSGRDDNLWAENLDEESSRVWCIRAFFNDKRDWDLGKEFTGLNVSDFEGFLGLSHIFAEHFIAEVERKSRWNLDGFRKTEPSSVWLKHRSLADDEVLLELRRRLY